MGRKTVMNKLTTPEEILAYNPENRRLKEDFLSYLASIQRSPQTRRGYNSDLDIFFVYVMKNCGDKPFVKLSKRDIIAYQNWLIQDNQNSPARVRRLKAALSSLSNYIENILDDEYENFRPIIKKIENPANVAVREKTVLSLEQLHYLLDELVKQEKEQIACAIALGMSSGRRKSELTLFKPSYFTSENIIFGSLYKTPEKIKTKGRGLGKYIYCYTLKNEFQKYFDIWMDKRKELGVESEWLFVLKKGDNWERVSADTLNSWADICSKILGENFYFHSLRHFFTTLLSVEYNIPDTVIQTIIAWDSADMVGIYRDVDDDDEIGKYFNEDGIVKVESGTLASL